MRIFFLCLFELELSLLFKLVFIFPIHLCGVLCSALVESFFFLRIGNVKDFILLFNII